MCPYPIVAACLPGSAHTPLPALLPRGACCSRLGPSRSLPVLPSSASKSKVDPPATTEEDLAGPGAAGCGAAGVHEACSDRAGTAACLELAGTLATLRWSHARPGEGCTRTGALQLRDAAGP
eukprot:scaffold5_cov112-Isochrysis_galbana.AAC.2